MSQIIITKDPDSIIEHVFDWSDELQHENYVRSAIWAVDTIEENGLTIVSPYSSGNKYGTLMAGGVVGHRYQLTCRAVIGGGIAPDRTIDRSVMIKVIES